MDSSCENILPSDDFVESQVDVISIENITSDDEIIETYIVQEDGSLLQIANAVEEEPKKLTRKRKRNCEKWKRNVSKTNRQSGKVYKNCKGDIQPARRVKIKGCRYPDRCPFACMTKLNQSARETIFDSFWGLNDPEKRHFYVSNIKKSRCVRKRTKAVSSQKSHNLLYYFNYMDNDIQVCQQFFVNTLDISQGRVYYYFRQNKGKATITPSAPRHGKHAKKVLSIEQKQGIRDHINKFPVVESHYCRKNTNKSYLYQGLNLSIMYRLYVDDTVNPAKFSAYRNIFNYEFNLAFFCPKKDRCDKCMSFETLKSPTKEEEDGQNLHALRKTNAYVERKKDRDIVPAVHEQRKSAIVAADMENVFQLPITNASIAYYSRKFSVLSFTAVINKTVYNAMWNESLCGREGTHIANALIKLLTRITQDNPDLEHLTIWSDSCVPQNRNSIVSAAIQRFIDSSVSRIQQIDQKFSEAGHSQIQEVDSAHSVIEKFLRRKFIYSPPALIDEIRKIPESKLKFVVVEMEEHDYLDYQLLAHAYNYTVIPYTKVKQLTYKKNQFSIWMKLDFPDDFTERTINLKPSKAISIQGSLDLELSSKLSIQKIEDIRSMYGIMPETDRLFYDSVFAKINTDVKINNTNVLKEHSKTTTRVTLNNAITKPKQKVSRLSPAAQKSIQQNFAIQRIPDIEPSVDDAPKILNLHGKKFNGLGRLTRGSSNALSPANNMKAKDQPTKIQLVAPFGNEYKMNGHDQIDASKRVSTRKRQIPAFLKSYNL